MIDPPADWETDRLYMRPAVTADAREAFASYTTDPLVPRYMTWLPHHAVEETEEFFRRCEEVWQRRLAFPWSIRRKEGGEFAGMLEARFREHSVEIGYVLARHLWRQGLMGEVVKGFARWAMSQPKMYRVWAVCDVDNLASARLLESVGMQLEGTLRRWLVHPNVSATPRDCFCYSLVKSEVVAHERA